MKPYRLLALVVLVLFAGGTAPGASSDTCRDTEVVFYSLDTMRLATELSKSGSACADYYLSVTPTTLGGPRPGPLTTLRPLGSRFHGMPEVRFENSAGYAATHGWYAAGVEFRRQMRTVGYDVSLGDTWAINEIGVPSNKGMGAAVLRNAGSKRRDFLDFVRGLYTGDDGIARPGLVFVADPAQVTTDLAQYEQELAAWYADAPFWNELGQYVRFWAQETYADATAWGVPGSPLADRSAYLNDYFLHGIRLAQRDDGSTAAARAFFARAYTPVGNASYRSAGPDPTKGIGFGKTDIGLPGMLSFVSAQTHALRASSGDRFGFALAPNSSAADTVAIATRIGAAIQASESDPAGACGSSGVLCDAAVAGASFNDAWKIFANTLEGSPVLVQVSADVTVDFPSVTARGSTWVDSAPLSAPAPARFQAVPGTLEQQLATTAVHGGPVEVCVDHDLPAYEGYTPRLFLRTGDGWSDVTTSMDVSAVCGSSAALGTVAIFAADPTPPVIVPTVAGQLGSNGWYTGDVTVTWSVVDPQSQSLVTSGCGQTRITADTSGATLTCTARSDGGTSSASVTVKRDATPPAVTCAATRSTLWPPNRKLVPVAVRVTVTDATSGAGAFRLVAAGASDGDSEDIVAFEVGTADVAGALRAERAGSESERVYSLAYTAHDLAGNAAGCVATVVVPHDQRD